MQVKGRAAAMPYRTTQPHFALRTAMPQPAARSQPWNSELVARYDVAGPRYTSYPTAQQFRDGFDADDYAALCRAMG
jgi:oxygen-independent coproporphyrinogen-3 oxidase